LKLPRLNRPLIFGLARPVIALGLVSLFTDFSSEMIIPLLPVFLTTQLGASAAFFGLIEGVAETVASLLKLVSGAWSDRMGARRPWVLFGYSLSAIMRPLMAVCVAPWQALVVRSADRVGKGLRSAPRDALLVAVTPPESRGWAFGFHRAMDHTGALLGAAAAALFLFWGWEVRQVFWIAAIPGVFAVLTIWFGVKEEKGAVQDAPAKKAKAALSFSWKTQPGGLKQYLMVLAVFTLANSSDAFLLLKAHDVGVRTALAPVLWIVLHVGKAVSSLVGGKWSDKIGPRRVIGAGWMVYAVVYLLFGWCSQPWQVWMLFAVYGLYHGLTEGAEKAMVAEFAAPERRGEAFGLYHSITGLLALPASLWMGLAWDHWGSMAAFEVTAGITLLAVGMFGVVCRKRKA